MKDTSPHMEQKFREMLMTRSNEERFMMGISMFDTARHIVISSIKHENPDISEEELRVQIFLRFYGSDFSTVEKKKIIAYLRKHTPNKCT